MSAVDYTPVILAQLTDLQVRLTKQDAIIAALKAEVERIGGRPSVSDGTTMRTSVPLRSGASEYKPRFERGQDRQYDSRPPRSGPHTTGSTGGPSRVRPKVASNDKTSTGPHPTMTLADVLKNNEEVTMEVRTGKDKEGGDSHATVVATFDGNDLVVTKCALAESLVGTKSSKPGEILYKFIDELKKADHIKRTFTIAPWRLCFVERDGSKKSLEDLRTTLG
jgi:hypothetical protein